MPKISTMSIHRKGERKTLPALELWIPVLSSNFHDALRLTVLLFFGYHTVLPAFLHFHKPNVSIPRTSSESNMLSLMTHTDLINTPMPYMSQEGQNCSGLGKEELHTYFLKGYFSFSEINFTQRDRLYISQQTYSLA